MTNITTKYYGNQIVLTDNEFLISISKNHSYTSYIGEKDCPEKVLLNIQNPGYYEISYDDVNGFSYRSVSKPERVGN